MIIAFCPSLNAQDNSLGTTWSFAGIGIAYERNVSADAFAHVSIQTEMLETFIGRTEHPGLSAAFTWNLVFAQIESRNGTPVRFFAGPGIAAGLSCDLDTPRGMYFGLKGRVGVQCIYDRKVNISVSLAPLLGIHVSQRDENIMTQTYKNGLLSAIFPEIGISYRF